MSNPWTRFGALISAGAKTIVTVDTVNADGTSTVTLRDSSTLRAQGDSVTAGQKAVIQNGKIIGKAPALASVSVEV